MALGRGLPGLWAWFLLDLLRFAHAQTTYVSGTFQGAIYVTNPAFTPAVQAQCPADHPVQCSAIQEPDYCCPSSCYCAYATGNVVGCCGWGQTCSGAIGGGGGGAYTPTTTTTTTSTPTTYWTSPTSTWYAPETIVVTSWVNGGGPVAPGGYMTTTTTVVYGGQPAAAQGTTAGEYCSTLTANGAGLPTVRSGECGQVLVVAAGAARHTVGWWTLTAAIGALHLLGAALFWMH